MSTLETGQPDHWRSMSNPTLDALPTEEAAAIIADRARDLFAGEVVPTDPSGHQSQSYRIRPRNWTYARLCP